MIKSNRYNKGLINIIVAVDTKTRNGLIEKGYLYVEWTKCKIADSYDVKRCYNCSVFGHLNTTYTKKVPVCSFCAEAHDTRLYTAHIQKCANCSNKIYKTNLDIKNITQSTSTNLST